MTSRRICRRGFLAALGASVVAGCLGDDDSTGTPEPTDWTSFEELGPHDLDIEAPSEAPTTDIEVEPVIEHLEIPWDIDADSDGNLWLTERTGQILHFDAEEVEAVVEPIDAIDAGAAEDGWWVEGGEGGTLGIAVSPDDEHLFVYYTAEANGGIENRVARYPINGRELGEPELILDGIPADNVHNGGRLEFGPDGHLWVTTGDAGDRDLSRDPSSLAGKILRVDTDGSAAPDNPGIGDDRIYCGGIRNAQGIDWLRDDIPIFSEHGPLARDEISLGYAGGDYGWDDVRGGPVEDEVPDADEEDFDRYGDRPEIVPPVINTGNRTWAPSGITWYTGEGLPSWQGRLLVGGLGSEQLYIVTLHPTDEDLVYADRTFNHEMFDGAINASVNTVDPEIGRIRHVEQGPNGEVYALTSNWDGRSSEDFPIETDDRVVRIVPK